MVKITPGHFEYYANVVGINLGSTNSYLSVLGFTGDKHTPIVINKFPSVVHLKSGSDPGNTVYDLMRLIGRSFDDPIVQKDIKRNELCGFPWPYKIVRSPPNVVAYGNKDLAWVKTSYGHLCSPVLMLQNFLANMKQTAGSYIGHGNFVNGAMFALPRAKISSSMIKAINEAAYEAGLVNNGFIFQSTAAAIAYGLHNKEECRFFAVVDLGARTFNVSIIERVDSKPCFKTKGYAMGDLFLGGEDFDNILMEYLVSEAKKGNGFTTTKDIPLLALQKFRRLAEQAKLELSSASEIKITLPPITSTDDASRGIEKYICIGLTRSKFEGLASNLIERIKGECLSCLEEACITARDVDEVVLVGGMARVPMVERVVKEIFGKTPCRGSIAPDEAVALGAISAAVHDKCMGIHDDDLWTLFD
ncbi:Chaperone protein dnak [Thalictrum thalictroides]|uniref:Chaperone protein dnak n=1 Tax=Thalictrum thalictroides TaxID=46969 RepID=A0A7J6X050_THATH|nr:Chaperone protein dnak [Thalictrum thalictroides]